MLISVKKIRASRYRYKKYSNSCVVRKKISERNKKPYPPPPLKLNGPSLITMYSVNLYYVLNNVCLNMSTRASGKISY